MTTIFSVNVCELSYIQILPSKSLDDSFMAEIGESVRIFIADQERARQAIQALRVIADALEENLAKLPAMGATSSPAPLGVYVDGVAQQTAAF